MQFVLNLSYCCWTTRNCYVYRNHAFCFIFCCLLVLFFLLIFGCRWYTQLLRCVPKVSWCRSVGTLGHITKTFAVRREHRISEKLDHIQLVHHRLCRHRHRYSTGEYSNFSQLLLFVPPLVPHVFPFGWILSRSNYMHIGQNNNEFSVQNVTEKQWPMFASVQCGRSSHTQTNKNAHFPGGKLNLLSCRRRLRIKNLSSSAVSNELENIRKLFTRIVCVCVHC